MRSERKLTLFITPKIVSKCYLNLTSSRRIHPQARNLTGEMTMRVIFTLISESP